MKVVFFGTSTFSVVVLECLMEGCQVLGVVTKPDGPRWVSPVKEWVDKNAPQIPMYQPKKASAEEFIALMKALDADVFVVAAYGQILKEPLLQAARLGSINVHASLLPKWRGAAPIQRSLMAGEKETGVTIMQMVLELDAGDMLDKGSMTVPDDMTHGELQDALAILCKKPLMRVLERLEKGTVKGEPQDVSQVTFAAKVTPLDTEIVWEKDARDVHNQIRGLSPEPGAWTWVLASGVRKKMKIKRSRVVEGGSGEPRQTVSLTSKEWVVGCGRDSLSLVEVQLEGKKTLPIADFLRGFQVPPQILPTE